MTNPLPKVKRVGALFKELSGRVTEEHSPLGPTLLLLEPATLLDPMASRLVRLEVAVLALIALSSLASALPAQGACPPGVAECIAPPYAIPAEPVWATLNGVAGGNYPGGTEVFTVFIANSDSPPLGNVTLNSVALNAPFQNASLSGLPLQLAPGQTLSTNMTIQIPRDFAQNNFTAYIAINFDVANATASTLRELTGSAQVFMLGAPLSGMSSTSSSTSATQSTTQGGTVSASLFYAGVGIPSLIVIVLLALLVRPRGRPQASPPAA